MEFKIIDESQREIYFIEKCPFSPVPKFSSTKYCLHCAKLIKVKDYKVEIFEGEELIVCPNAPECNGSALDWMHKDLKKELEQ